MFQTNLDFTKYCIYVCENIDVVYALGGWGQPLTETNKQFFFKNYPKNYSNETIRKGIEAATENSFAGDCVCIIKSILDGFKGDKTQKYGGATYGKPCPDITVKDMLYKQCVDVSTDFTNCLVGEFVSYGDYSHCGIYAGYINGKRMVAECTYGWNNGFQLIDMDCSSRKGKWKYHGKLWNYMNYSYKESSVYPTPSPSTAKEELQKCVNEIDSILSKMNTIIETL